MSIMNEMILQHSRSSDHLTEINQETVFKSSIYARPEHSKSFAIFNRGSDAVIVQERTLANQDEIGYLKDPSPLVENDGTPMRTKL